MSDEAIIILALVIGFWAWAIVETVTSRWKKDEL